MRGVLARIERAVGKGETVNLVGFGRFEVYKRSARRGRTDRRKLKDPGNEGGAFQDRQTPSRCRGWIEARARRERQEVAVANSGRWALETEQIRTVVIGSPWRRAPEDAFSSRRKISQYHPAVAQWGRVPQPARGRITEAATMTLRYAVGIRIRNKTDQMTVEAEDALIAALKVKTTHPEAAITYVRKQNVRGDRRHPHSSQIDKKPAGRATRQAAQSRSSLQTVYGTFAEAMPDPVPKPPGRPPGELIIIKNPPRPPEAPEIDGSLNKEDEPEIQKPPAIIPEKPPPPAPWERADRPSDGASTVPR